MSHSTSTRLFSPAASQLGPKKEGVAALPDDEDALHDWMDKFNSRIQQKEAERDRKNEIQWAKHSQEIAAVHERRQREKMEEQLQQQREDEEAELKAQEAAAKEAFQERVATMTADLTHAERDRWIEDDEAISKLEKEMEERTSRMDKAGVEINQWMDGYQAKLKAQEEAVQQDIREKEEAHAAFLQGQTTERLHLEEIALSSRSHIEEQEEVEERSALAVKESEGILIAEEKARVNMYNAVSEEQRKMLDAMPAEKRKATLDDLREIDALSQGVKRIAPGAATSGTTIANEDHGVVRYLWDSVKVGAPELETTAAVVGTTNTAVTTCAPHMSTNEGMSRGCTLSSEDAVHQKVGASPQASCSNSPLKLGDCLPLSPGQLGEQQTSGSSPSSHSVCTTTAALEVAIASSQVRIETLKKQLEMNNAKMNNPSSDMEPQKQKQDTDVVVSLSAEDKMRVMEEVITEQAKQLALVAQLQQLQQHQQTTGNRSQSSFIPPPPGGDSPQQHLHVIPTGAGHPAGQESRASLLSVVTPLGSEGTRSREGSQ